MGCNTRFDYLYRDGSNYKQPNSVILAGTLTREQKKEIAGCLDDGMFFIPSQIGLPEIRFSTITEDDHCWFETSDEAFEETDKAPTVDITAEELLQRFLEKKDNWNGADDSWMCGMKWADDGEDEEGDDGDSAEEDGASESSVDEKSVVEELEDISREFSRLKERTDTMVRYGVSYPEATDILHKMEGLKNRTDTLAEKVGAIAKMLDV